MTATLQDAMSAIARGDKVTSQRILATIIKSEPRNEMAWMFLASIQEDQAKKRQCLDQVLAINPDNGEAILELRKLQNIVLPVQTKPAEEKRSSIESIQCPKCGAPVDVITGRELLHCSYCGARLKISRGSSGHAMATLDDIKIDTSLIAKEATHNRLRSDLVSMESELANLDRAWKQKIQTLNKSGISGTALIILMFVLFIGIACVGMRTGSESAYLTILLVAIGVSLGIPLLIVTVSTMGTNAQRKGINGHYQPRILELTAKISDTKQRMERIKTEMDSQDNQI